MDNLERGNKLLEILVCFLHKFRLCRWNGYRGIPVHLLLGPVIGLASALEAINNLQRGEDPHEETPREENDDGNC
jgi:hypothetical protein